MCLAEGYDKGIKIRKYLLQNRRVLLKVLCTVYTVVYLGKGEVQVR